MFSESVRKELVDRLSEPAAQASLPTNPGGPVDPKVTGDMTWPVQRPGGPDDLGREVFVGVCELAGGLVGAKYGGKIGWNFGRTVGRPVGAVLWLLLKTVQGAGGDKPKDG